MIFFWLPGFPAGCSHADLIIYTTNTILKLQQLIISTSNTVVTRAIVTPVITPIAVIIVCLLKRLIGFLFQSSTDAAVEGNFQHKTGDVNPERPGRDLRGRVRLMNPVQECASQPGARHTSACLALLH